jgi:Flp pilus assembly protein TadB
MAVVTLAAIGAAAAVAGTIYSVKSANDARADARKAVEEQTKTADALAKQSQNRADQEESQATSNTVRDDAKKRQQALSAGAQGRQSTILTSPLGIQGNAAGGTSAAGAPPPGKTLLGM